MINLLDLDFNELSQLLVRFTDQKFRAKQVFDALYKGKEFAEMTDISNDLKNKLAAECIAQPVKVYKKFISTDGTVKYLLELQDKNIIEAVLMQYKYGKTLCVSSQVGCPMGCAFCASGINGLVRNLTAGEILGEVISINRDAGQNFERVITNIVMMGSGEPLYNYENTVKFLKLVNSADGLNISQRNISVSTCGLPDKIKQLADDGFSITLTISLHSANNEIRKKIMPVAREYNLKQLMDSATYYFNKTGRRVILEYVLIKGVNDSIVDIRSLAQTCKHLVCHVNVIRLNTVKEKALEGVTKAEAYKFVEGLTALGVSATLRRTMGADIEGACGQLRRRVIADDDSII